MFRYAISVMAVLFLLSSGAWAQQIRIDLGRGFPVSFPGARQNQCPPGHYYCNQHRSFCSHGYNNGRRYNNGRYNGHNYGNRHKRKHKRRNQRRNNCNDDYGYRGTPPGHYYCNNHRSYCSHR